MSKQLKDILKQAHDRIKGVRTSKTETGSLGKDPGVDYEPKAPAERDYVASRTVEKHADRVGNGDDIYQATNVKYSLDTPQNKHMGRKKKEAEQAAFPPSSNASIKEDEAKCNPTPQGKECPVHGMTECSSDNMIKEKAKKKVNFLKTQIETLSETSQQKYAAKKFLIENTSAKLVGKTNKNNLVFRMGEKDIKITPKGTIQ